MTSRRCIHQAFHCIMKCSIVLWSSCSWSAHYLLLLRTDMERRPTCSCIPVGQTPTAGRWCDSSVSCACGRFPCDMPAGGGLLKLQAAFSSGDGIRSHQRWQNIHNAGQLASGSSSCMQQQEHIGQEMFSMHIVSAGQSSSFRMPPLLVSSTASVLCSFAIFRRAHQTSQD